MGILRSRITVVAVAASLYPSVFLSLVTAATLRSRNLKRRFLSRAKQPGTYPWPVDDGR